jgi:putative aldouronate transport system substrate-binding protein
MCKKILRVPAMALVLTLAVSAGVFAGGGGQKSSSQDVTVLTVPSVFSGRSGIQDEGAYWVDIYREDLGIVLEAIIPSPEAWQAALAARDLPDIISSSNAEHINTMVQGGMLINLDDYKDKLPNVFAYGGAMIPYVRDNVSPGRLDVVSIWVGAPVNPRGNSNLGPYLRWDYYKELGYPEIIEFEDYLPVLKAMVDRHPLTEAGQKVYGISLWSDWDGGILMSTASFPAEMMGRISAGSFLEIDPATGASWSVLDDASAYKRALKFYYTANQMGILDPDSITQGWTTFLEKGTAGRNLFGLQSYSHGSFNTPERAAAGVGTKLVPFKNQKARNVDDSDYVGNGTYLGINKNTKNLEKALAFLNYYFSPEGSWQLYNGRQGVAWDLDENGEPYWTELGWQIKYNGAEVPNGDYIHRGATISSNGTGLTRYSINPLYKRRADGMDWVTKDHYPKDTALVADWKRVMKAEDDMDYFTKNNMLFVRPFARLPTNVPEDIQTLVNRVGQVVQPTSWKMVYAKDEAEFNSLWADMVSQAKGIGIDRVNQWYLDAYNAAKASGAKYMY